jgi:DNA-binding transcriptional ArsR family regulator
MQDSQIVFPKFSRYSRSPVLIPRIKSRVKRTMSQMAFLGMDDLRGQRHFKAGARYCAQLFYYSRRRGPEEKFFCPRLDIFLTKVTVLAYMNIMNNKYMQERLEKAARCLKVLAHPIRLMIIHLLGEGERSVQELERAVGVSQSSISQHLNLLKDKEILESRRVAQQVFYRLANPRLLDLIGITRELFCKLED